MSTATEGPDVDTTRSLTCIIYARVSTDEQADRDFSSIDAQLAACRRKAEANGWRIVQEYREEASGKNLRRPGMEGLIATLKRTRIDVVIATRLDRLSRDTVDTEYLINLCRNREAELVLLQQPLDEATATGRMGRRMNSVFNQFEREMISDRVCFKRGELIRNGMRPGGWTPPGYNLLDAHTYTLDEKDAPMVLQVFEQAAVGRRICDIAVWLRSNGFIVRPRVIQRRSGKAAIGGKPYTWDQIKAIIRNPIYKAVIVADGVEQPIKIPRIVSDDLWKRANAAVKKNGNPNYTTRQNKHELLLHGLAVCGCCRAPLVAHPARSRTGKIYLYYRCQNQRKNGRLAGCKVHQIPAPRFENAVVEQIGVLAKDPTVLNSAMNEALSGRKAQLLPLRAEIAENEAVVGKLTLQLKGLRDRLMSLPKDSPFTKEIVAEGDRIIQERGEAEDQRRMLLEKKAVLDQQLGDGSRIRKDVGRFSDIFAVLSPEKKRQALRLLIRRIVVNHLPAEVTESDAKLGRFTPLRQKARLLVNLELYVNSQFASALRKEAGFFVFRTEMAARAGIEPATK
jgi:site-specific DNA recombinase